MLYLRNKHSVNKQLCSGCNYPYTVLMGSSGNVSRNSNSTIPCYLVISSDSPSLCLEKAFERRDCGSFHVHIPPKT